jgi:hypothetical protein
MIDFTRVLPKKPAQNPVTFMGASNDAGWHVIAQPCRQVQETSG